MSSVAIAVCVASDLTSLATTAKPRPASPARAASMVALSASRLVWDAMSLISCTTSPMRCAASASPFTVTSVLRVSLTALPAISAACVTCRPISPTESDSSSEALATVSTLAEACVAAPATAVAWRSVSSAVADMLSEVLRISTAACASASSKPRIEPSNAATCCSMVRCRCSLRSCSSRCVASMRSFGGHGVAEYGERPGEMADLVVAVLKQDGALQVAARHHLHVGGDCRHRPRDPRPDEGNDGDGDDQEEQGKAEADEEIQHRGMRLLAGVFLDHVEGGVGDVDDALEAGSGELDPFGAAQRRRLPGNEIGDDRFALLRQCREIRVLRRGIGGLHLRRHSRLLQHRADELPARGHAAGELGELTLLVLRQ